MLPYVFQVCGILTATVTIFDLFVFPSLIPGNEHPDSLQQTVLKCIFSVSPLTDVCETVFVVGTQEQVLEMCTH